MKQETIEGNTNKTTQNQMNEAGKGLYDRAVETAGKVYDAVSEKASDSLDSQTSSLSDGLNQIADGIRQTGSHLTESTSSNTISAAAADYSSTAADAINSVADYFASKDPREMLRDAEGLARRNPAVFMAAAFGLGILAARFLKSSPRSLTEGAGRTFQKVNAGTRGRAAKSQGN